MFGGCYFLHLHPHFMDFLAFFTTFFFAGIFTSPPFPLLAELLKARIAAKHVASPSLFFTTR
jgi:hypothetical protein